MYSEINIRYISAATSQCVLSFTCNARMFEIDKYLYGAVLQLNKVQIVCWYCYLTPLVLFYTKWWKYNLHTILISLFEKLVLNLCAVVIQNIKILQLDMLFLSILNYIACVTPMSTTCAPIITKAKNKTNKSKNVVT